MDPKEATMVLIDLQRGLNEPRTESRNNLDAEANARRLLSRWRDGGGAVVHVRHDSVEPHSRLRPELPGNRPIERLEEAEGELVVRKRVNCGFVGTDLEARLRGKGASRLVVAGATTDHCVSTTVHMASDLGFEVTLVEDACFAFASRGFSGEFYTAEQVHDVNLASLWGEFAELASTDEIVDP